MYRVRQQLVPVVAFLLLLGGCGGRPSASSEVVLAPGAPDRATISGAGSTFVAPMLREWMARYQRVAPGVTMEYHSAGSVTGVRQLESGTVDFAASELPLTEEQRTGVGGRPGLVSLPWTAGAIAVAYNFPAIGALRLSGTTLAAVFTGSIVTWNDPLILADNPGISLPSVPITPVYRSGPSGTTLAFADFLRSAAPENSALGTGATVRWPRGTAAEGSDGVIGAVKQTVGSVGYVGYAHALDANVRTASVRNGAGEFVPPTTESVNGAISGASSESPGAYPITSVSHVVFPAAGADPSKHAAVRHFVDWVLTEGQRSAEPHSYVRLPHVLLVDALEKVREPTRDSAAIGRSPR